MRVHLTLSRHLRAGTIGVRRMRERSLIESFTHGKPSVSLLADRYVLEDELGVGATARVFRAWDQTLGVARAVKLLTVPRGAAGRAARAPARRGAGDGAPRSPERPAGLRRGLRGRQGLRGDGAGGGGQPPDRHRRGGADPGGAGDRLPAPGPLRPAGRARERGRPPGRQAAEHPAQRQRHGDAGGLRHRPDGRRGAAHQDGRGDGLDGLHGRRSSGSTPATSRRRRTSTPPGRRCTTW